MSNYSYNKHLNFKEWASFGFGEKKLHDTEGGTKAITGHGPIDIIHSSKIISEILDSPAIGNLRLNQKFSNLIEWGSEVGALQLQLTPLGSYKVITRRKIADATGHIDWICKKIFPLEEGYHNTREEIYASEIHDYLTSLNETMIDKAKTDFNGFNKLSLKLFGAVRNSYQSYCMFPIGMLKKNEHYHKYIFEFRGHGVESPTSGRAEQFNIDFYWDAKKGLLRCWGYNIDSTTRQHSWKVQPSEWDENFAPTQEPKEIIDAVVKIFMTY